MPIGLLIDIDSHRVSTGGKIAGDYGSRDSTDTDNTLVGVRLVMSKEAMVKSLKDEYIPSPDVLIGADVNVGDIVYIVWAEYSTGDSFGNDGGVVEYIAAFVSETKAWNCQRYIQNTGNRSHGGRTKPYEIELEDGTKQVLSCPWHGYFEHLEDVHVTEIIIEE